MLKRGKAGCHGDRYERFPTATDATRRHRKKTNPAPLYNTKIFYTRNLDFFFSLPGRRGGGNPVPADVDVDIASLCVYDYIQRRRRRRQRKKKMRTYKGDTDKRDLKKKNTFR